MRRICRDGAARLVRVIAFPHRHAEDLDVLAGKAHPGISRLSQSLVHMYVGRGHVAPPRARTPPNIAPAALGNCRTP